MSLVPVDLPDLETIRGRWAALAGIVAARGWQEFCAANGVEWYYHDGGGNWAMLRLSQDGRALLFGHDHEYSETYFRDAAAYFEEEETDLLAGAPPWWAEALDIRPWPSEWVGFVYGWDGTGWQRAAYDIDDGFGSVGLAVRTREDTVADIEGSLEHFEPPVTPSSAAVAALVDAGTEVTREQAAAVLGPGRDPEPTVVAAQRFRPGAPADARAPWEPPAR